jgi:lipopolysaccharide transport system ATP-binding protein
MSAGQPWAIKVDGLTKRYRLGVFDSNLRQTISAGAKGLLRAARGGREAAPGHDWFWALRGVSLEVPKGQIVGVVGHNGAGKSTLLKILARITEPSDGTVQFVGKVGSLLEVGTGFHPELSGRDNIFLNGAVLGMTHREVARHFDRIVDFAGVEQFIDTPVKRYSSGMYMRLAFAVAAHLDSDILLIDEVLAVGDAEFQKKCLSRIGEMAHDGRTVVFVSHNLAAVQSLCQRAILLDKGVVLADGSTTDVLQAYLNRGREGPTTQRRWPAEEAPRKGPLVLRGVRVEPVEGDLLAPLDITRPFRISLDYERLQAGAEVVALNLVDEAGILLFNVSNPALKTSPAGLYRESCVVPGDLLNAGAFRVSVTLYDEHGQTLEVQDAIAFDLLDSDRDRHGWYGKWPGVLRPCLDWTCDPVAT